MLLRLARNVLLTTNELYSRCPSVHLDMTGTSPGIQRCIRGRFSQRLVVTGRSPVGSALRLSVIWAICRPTANRNRCHAASSRSFICRRVTDIVRSWPITFVAHIFRYFLCHMSSIVGALSLSGVSRHLVLTQFSGSSFCRPLTSSEARLTSMMQASSTLVDCTSCCGIQTVAATHHFCFFLFSQFSVASSAQCRLENKFSLSDQSFKFSSLFF